MSVLGIVPARGGSKGVPGKNLAPVGGEPLLVHAIRAALAAGTVDRVVCSTDDDEIAAVARAAGAEVVVRPAELALDESPTEGALLHVLDALGPPAPEYVVTLEPTSPLRTADLIDACVRLAWERDADAVMTVSETHAVHGRLEDGLFVPLVPGQPRRRQLRAPLYRESSTVYVTKAAYLRATNSVVGDRVYALVVPEEQAIDINSELDFVVADALLRRRAGAPS
jgi:N-acylneuraminate cytidylyltransferase